MTSNATVYFFIIQIFTLEDQDNQYFLKIVTINLDSKEKKCYIDDDFSTEYKHIYMDEHYLIARGKEKASEYWFKIIRFAL